MPVPVRDDGSAGPTKHLLFFVHGFASDHTTWDPMLRCIRHDERLRGRYEVETVNYKTGLMAMPVIDRLPTVDEIGTYIDRKFVECMYDPATGRSRYIDATLIGHSMGGLAIKSMLTSMLEAGRGAEFDVIRQAIFFATPHFGSMTLDAFRRFVGKYVENPQSEMLHGFNDEVALLHEKTLKRIAHASRRESHRYPLPLTTFWGMEDNIVPQTSARGMLDSAFPLPGNHMDVHCPSDDVKDAYEALVDAIEHPHGHPAIFEVELFRYAAEVRPLPPGTVQTAQLADRTKDIVADNEARVTREVVFSMHNRCTEEFELKYRTSDRGYLKPQISPPVEMRPDHRSVYKSGGTAVNFGVPAGPGKRYTLNMHVLNGFSIGNRSFHQHCTNRCYYRRVRFELDLSAYLTQGWRITDEPKLFYHPSDSDDHELCDNRPWWKPVSGGVRRGDRWSWELEYVNRGVIDLTWDVGR